MRRYRDHLWGMRVKGERGGLEGRALYKGIQHIRIERERALDLVAAVATLLLLLGPCSLNA